MSKSRNIADYLPRGGAAGDALVKRTAADFDFEFGPGGGSGLPTPTDDGDILQADAALGWEASNQVFGGNF